MRRIKAYAMRVAILLWKTPHELQITEHVAAPQHDAAKPHNVPTLGSTSSGSDSRAPIVVRLKWDAQRICGR